MLAALDDPHFVFGIPFLPGLSIGADSGSRPAWRSILTTDGCVYCGRRRRRCPQRKPNNPRKIEVDHVDPLRGGGERPIVLNGTGCCVECNRAKGHTPLLHFLLGEGDRG